VTPSGTAVSTTTPERLIRINQGRLEHAIAHRRITNVIAKHIASSNFVKFAARKINNRRTARIDE